MALRRQPTGYTEVWAPIGEPRGEFVERRRRGWSVICGAGSMVTLGVDSAEVFPPRVGR